MKPLVILTGVAGLAVVGVGAYLITTSRTPAEQKIVSRDAPPGATPQNVPTHTSSAPQGGNPAAVFEQQRATNLQLLAKYESDLRTAQGEADISAQRMAQIEAAAAAACEGYASSPEWGYNCNGFPVCGWNEWWTVKGEKRDATAYGQCVQYVKGLGGIPATRTLERRADSGPEYQKWAAISEKVSGGYRSASDLRDQYAEAKRQQSDALARAARIRQQVNDLNAQGVF